jgi:hypothetical protein
MHISSRLPSLRVAVAVFTALLILFAWLHLLVAMQIASTDRLIIQRTAELERLEREKQAILLKIAEGKSPHVMTQRLLDEGFLRQELVYLDLGLTSTEYFAQVSERPAQLEESTVLEEEASSEPPSLLEAIIGSLRSRPQTQH